MTPGSLPVCVCSTEVPVTSSSTTPYQGPSREPPNVRANICDCTLLFRGLYPPAQTLMETLEYDIGPLRLDPEEKRTFISVLFHLL